ncbi:hypothetical protein N7U66_09465 [Lacinutrix neustonica]|uniref:Uncharacterized protein n=1 Tax=Lacinutrix neustonica TaxID=2980107 RepID=A0A9E8MZB7_9FLAO|nr:hypothetical protein [Lacinutrix neustonica]WAC03654.1 hypothetical protein N7U66_09465 [Lacinutrix neustonica]
MYRLLLISLIILSSCKSETKSVEKELPLAQKIANAHGFEHWKNVEQIQFTFNVDQDTMHFERSWTWNPKAFDVKMVTETDTIAYNRLKIEESNINADRAFVNDKFTLLFPYQLAWDDGTILTVPIKAEAPISKTQLNKTTLLYVGKGGYTPGDAYDIFYDDNYLIKEWVFREGNAKEPTMINTFENYTTFNGLHLALDHKKAEGNWSLNFTNVSVTTK